MTYKDRVVSYNDDMSLHDVFIYKIDHGHPFTSLERLMRESSPYQLFSWMKEKDPIIFIDDDSTEITVIRNCDDKLDMAKALKIIEGLKYNKVVRMKYLIRDEMYLEYALLNVVSVRDFDSFTPVGLVTEGCSRYRK